MTKTLITKESHLSFYRTNVLTGKYKQFIVERVDEEFGLASYPIATVYLKDIDDENKRCELCLFTSDDIEWGADGQKIAIKMMLDKAFIDYGMHKVYSYVFPKFADEVNLLLGAGFAIEAVLKEESFSDNAWEDVVRLAAINNNAN